MKHNLEIQYPARIPDEDMVYIRGENGELVCLEVPDDECDD